MNAKVSARMILAWVATVVNSSVVARLTLALGVIGLAALADEPKTRMVASSTADEPWARMVASSTADRHRCTGPARWRVPACDKWKDPVMAKTTSWSGGLSGDWSVAGNWTNGVPAATDTVIIPSTATRHITAGLDQNAVDIGVLDIRQGCKINIGLSGNPLHIADDSGGAIFYHAGSGALYLNASSTCNLFVQSPNMVNAVTGVGEIFARAVIIQGRAVNLGADRVELVGPDARFYEAGSVGASAHIIMSDGVAEIGGSLGSPAIVYLNGGDLTYTGSGMTLLWQFGGSITFKGTTGVLTAYLVGGVCDFSQNDSECTITTLYKYADAELLESPSLTITNEMTTRIYD
jgi:hypothetical protein